MSSSPSYNKGSDNNKKPEVNSPESTSHGKEKKTKQQAVAIEKVLKTFQFPTNNDRILEFVKFQSRNPASHQILSIIQKIENRQYKSVDDVIKAANNITQ
jgi:hypothetical protein